MTVDFDHDRSARAANEHGCAIERLAKLRRYVDAMLPVDEMGEHHLAVALVDMIDLVLGEEGDDVDLALRDYNLGGA